MSLQQIIAIVIFLCTMGAIITGKVHNTVASLTGAACLVLTHILSIEDCIDAVDVETICILVGMMLLVAVIKNSGIFECKRSSLADHGDFYFDHSCLFWNA